MQKTVVQKQLYNTLPLYNTERFMRYIVCIYICVHDDGVLWVFFSLSVSLEL